MPRPAYQNTFRPNTEIGAGLANLTAALFPSRATAQELAEAEAKRALYAAQTEAGLARAQKFGQETISLGHQNRGLEQITDPYTLAGALRSDAKQMQDARKGEMLNEIIANTAIENDPVRQGQQLEFLRRLKFADGGKDRYSMNTNNVTLDQFGGDVGNEANDLNQAKITDQLESASLKANQSTTELTKQDLNRAKTQAEGRRGTSTGTSTLVETYTGVDANGNPTFKLVPKDVNTVITKTPPAKKQGKGLTLKDTADMRRAIEESLGVLRDGDGSLMDGSLPELDSNAIATLTDAAAQDFQSTGNMSQSIRNVVARLTGNGNNLVGSREGAVRTTIDPFGIVPVPFKDPVTKKRGLPQQKPAVRGNSKPTPAQVEVPPDVQELLNMYGGA